MPPTTPDRHSPGNPQPLDSPSSATDDARISAGRLRRLRLEVDKLEAFSLIVRAASAAPNHEAFAEVSRAAANALRAKFGAGSITSAFTWLGGAAAQAALDSVLAGQVALTGPLSAAEITQAIGMAKQAEALQQPGASSG